jgi:hypothetical protein
MAMTPGAVYDVTGIDVLTSNLTVKNGYLASLGLSAGDTIIFDIGFDHGNELLTVNVIDSTLHPPGGGGGGSGSVEQPPSGPLVDRMPGYVTIGKPIKISPAPYEIELDLAKPCSVQIPGTNPEPTTGIPSTKNGWHLRHIPQGTVK